MVFKREYKKPHIPDKDLKEFERITSSSKKEKRDPIRHPKYLIPFITALTINLQSETASTRTL